MTSPADRVAVPTNGHRPALTDDALEAPSIDGSEEPGAGRAGSAVSTVTPGQLIAGLGIVAALALLVLGRRRPRG